MLAYKDGRTVRLESRNGVVLGFLSSLPPERRRGGQVRGSAARRSKTAHDERRGVAVQTFRDLGFGAPRDQQGVHRDLDVLSFSRRH